MSSEQCDDNQLQVLHNKRRIFELENRVDYNSANAQLTRAEIQENLALLQRNFAASFTGNRALASQNMADLYRNRALIIDTLDADTSMQETFIGMMSNRTKLEQLSKRSELNRQTLEINQRLAKISKLYGEINSMIADSNQSMVEYNRELINENAAWIDGALQRMQSEATPSSLANDITANEQRLHDLAEQAENNAITIESLMRAADADTKTILAAGEQITERRRSAMINREKVAANQQRAADLLVADPDDSSDSDALSLDF